MTAAEGRRTNKDKKEPISSSVPSSFANHKDDNNISNNNINKNKIDHGELRSPEELRQIVHEFLPFARDDDNMIVHGFGYGSGVLMQQPQPHSQGDTKVVDVILVVRNAADFHRANVQCNPHHYTLGLRSSPERAAWWQRHVLPENPWLRNPGVYFVVTPNLKYGIVQYEDLCQDLQHWTCLYLAGRLHKPVVTFKKDDRIQFLQQQHNLPAALAAALLLQYHNDCQQHEAMEKMAATAAAEPLSSLYSGIASLSYQGDPRLTLAAEDPNKIAQLVAPQHFSRWQSLYADAMLDLQTAGLISIDHHHHTYQWDRTNPKAHRCLWQSLPQHVRQQCGYHSSPLSSNNKTNEDTLAMRLLAAAAQALPTVLAGAIVAPAARYQSFKGLWTAGPTQSVRYAYRKFQKGRGRGG